MYFVEKVFDDNFFDKSKLPVGFDKDNSVFFDIETSGLSPKTSFVFLIGICYFKDSKIILRQYFANSQDDEIDILKNFFEDVKHYKTVYHFNGLSFDIPYVNMRFELNNLNYHLIKEKSFDIYKAIKSNKNIINLRSYKLKSIEEYIGIYRMDDLSGAEIVEAYKTFLNNKNASLREKILLHNEEDILNLYKLLPLIDYNENAQTGLKINNLTYKDSDSSATFSGNIELENTHTNLNIRSKCYSFKYSKTDNTFELSFPIQNGNVYYFYEDYSDYYYIPQIDQAIHKSVIKYYNVKEKLKANAKNCYSRIDCKFIQLPLNFKSENIKFCTKGIDNCSDCIIISDLQKIISTDEFNNIIGLIVKNIAGN